MPDELLLSMPRQLLDADDEVSLARRIEAGVLAAELLTAGPPYGALGGALGGGSGPTETELELLVEAGRSARHRFVEANLRLVSMISQQAAVRGGLSASDLFQEGCLGLLTAVQRFDHRRGCRFATYALYWIRAYVGEASASRLGELNVPGGRATRLRTVRGLAGSVSQVLGREATAAEVAEALGRSELWTSRLLATGRTVSLDADEWAARSAETSNDGSELEVRQRARLVQRLWGQLYEQERQVLGLRLGFEGSDPLPYAQVAARLAIGVAKVHRIERAAIEKLQGVCPASARQHL